MFSLTLIFLALVVLLDSQDSTTELQKAAETSGVAPSEHDLPQEVSGIEMKEAGKGCFGKKNHLLNILICFQVVSHHKVLGFC